MALFDSSQNVIIAGLQTTTSTFVMKLTYSGTSYSTTSSTIYTINVGVTSNIGFMGGTSNNKLFSLG